MKSNDVMLKEYAGSLSDDDLKSLVSRFKQNLAGDRAEIANFLSRNKEIDRHLSTAQGSLEWFDMVDVIGEAVITEYNLRCETPSDFRKKKIA